MIKRSLLNILICIVLSAGMVSAEEYIHYRLGKKYREQGEYDLAKDELKKVISVYPDHYNAYYMLGEIAKTEGDQSSAELYFQKALKYNPGWRSALRNLGKIYEENGQFDKAVQMYQQAQRGASGTELKNIEADLNRAAGRKKSTAPVKVSAVQKPKPKTSGESNIKAPSGPAPASARAELDKGIRSYRAAVQAGKSDFSTAVNHIRRALEIHPGYPSAYYYAGMIRRRLGDSKGAKYNFERAVFDPEQGYNAHFYLAKICAEQKDYRAAVEHYEAYRDQTKYEQGRREADAKIAEYKKLIGEQAAEETLNMEKVHQEEIEAELRKLPQRAEISEMQIRIDPFLTMVIADTATPEGMAMLKAVNEFKAKRYDRSIAEFRTVLEKYPRGKVAGLALYDLAICSMKLHDWSGAIDKFSQYRERFPQGNNVPNAIFLQAAAHFELKKYSASRQLLQKYIQENRDGQWVGKAYEKLGDIYREEDQLRSADEAYELAAKNSESVEDKIIALFKRGDVFAALKNSPMAVKQFELVIAEGEKNKMFLRVPDSYYRIADYLYRENKLTEAREKYQRVTRLYPSYQDTPWGLFQVGNIYKRQKQYDKAAAAYTQVITKYPEDYWASQAEWKKKDAVWQMKYGTKK